jgi:hypothetical protein
MNNLVVPDLFATQLESLSSPVPLQDSSGRTIGYFVPEVDLSEYEIAGLEPTNDELAEIERSTEWYSTEQVLRHLERLG